METFLNRNGSSALHLGGRRQGDITERNRQLNNKEQASRQADSQAKSLSAREKKKARRDRTIQDLVQPATMRTPK